VFARTGGIGSQTLGFQNGKNALEVINLIINA